MSELALSEHCEEETVVGASPPPDSLNLGTKGFAAAAAPPTSGRGTLVTDSLGLPSMMSLSLFSLINLALGFLLVCSCSVMGELDLELALSKEEGDDSEVAVAVPATVVVADEGSDASMPD